MQFSRREILQKFDFVPVGPSRKLVMVDRIDGPLARELRLGLQTRFDGLKVAREVCGQRRYLHLLIAERSHGPRPSPDHVCEHLNGDLLDCRRANLRWTWRRKKRPLEQAA
jgi:hypothetical protein